MMKRRRSTRQQQQTTRAATRSSESSPPPTKKKIRTTTTWSSRNENVKLVEKTTKTKTTTTTDDWPDIRTIRSSLLFFPETSLLFGCEDALWAALAHVPDAFETKYKEATPSQKRTQSRIPGKQWVVRHALDIIGMGWVATNSTQHRQRIGSFFDQALTIHKDNQFLKVTSPPPIPKVEIEDQYLKRECRYEDIQDIQQCLEAYGVAIIRRAVVVVGNLGVNDDNGGSSDNKGRTGGRKTQIQATTGNGKAGCEPEKLKSFYMDYYGSDDELLFWNSIQNHLLESFTAAGSTTTPKPKKAILLQYAQGAENWAHQDGNNDAACPYQACCLLSTPGTDFKGGEFYVAKRTADRQPPIVRRTIVKFQNAGDMVIFRADDQGGYLHGMLPVKSGTNAICKRVAVGLLQPRA